MCCLCHCFHRDLPVLGTVTVRVCRENYNKKKKERSDTDIGTAAFFFFSSLHLDLFLSPLSFSLSPSLPLPQERLRSQQSSFRKDRSTNNGKCPIPYISTHQHSHHGDKHDTLYRFPATHCIFQSRYHHYIPVQVSVDQLFCWWFKGSILQCQAQRYPICQDQAPVQDGVRHASQGLRRLLTGVTISLNSST